MYRKSMRSALEEARAYSAVNEVKVSKGGKTLNISKKDVEVYQAKGWSLQEANMKRILQALQDKLSDEGGAAGFDDLKKTAKSMGLNLTPAMLKDMPGIKQHRDGDYILEEIELDEALEVKWDSNKQGWFDKQGRRRYLGNMATNKLMSKAIDKAKETGDFINPFKLKHGQKPEETDLKEARWRIEGSLGYKRISPRDDFDMVIDAPTESAAEDKAYDELDKARDKRKIGPGGGGSVEDVEIETVERTNDRLSAPETFRGLN